jgi:3-oxoacyl-[acyl-carrier protein] reductase
MTHRVTIITGGSSGVGEAVALQLARRGEAVVINFSRNQALADQVVQACEAAGGQAIAVQGDVASDNSCRAVAAAAMARFGRIDALVNCAATTQFVPMTDLDGVQAEDFQRIYGVNAVGPFQMARAAARHMGEGAAIVNVSSIAGQTGSGSSFPYVMSKAALNILTVGLARVLSPRVRVNAVLPGMIEGRWMRDGLGDAAYEKVKAQFARTAALGRISTPEQIASAVCWLLEPGSVVTGQQIVVDAGFTLGKPPSAAGATPQDPAQ